MLPEIILLLMPILFQIMHFQASILYWINHKKIWFLHYLLILLRNSTMLIWHLLSKDLISSLPVILDLLLIPPLTPFKWLHWHPNFHSLKYLHSTTIPLLLTMVPTSSSWRINTPNIKWTYSIFTAIKSPSTPQDGNCRPTLLIQKMITPIESSFANLTISPSPCAKPTLPTPQTSLPSLQSNKGGMI